MPRLAKSLEFADDHYDVVIVGSGYGGGVSASRLARAGLRVCVLERGREFLTGEFPTRFPELRQDFQVTGDKIKTGRDVSLFDIHLGADMHVMVGCGLGGGSLVNAGVALVPDARVFADALWPEEISSDSLLEEGYARAHRWLRPAKHDGAMQLSKTRALAHSAAALDTEPKPCNVVISFEDTINQAGIEQPACTLCGDCCGGCNVGAKNTVALTYLPDAVRHGAALFTCARVSHVSKLERGGWCVHVSSLDGSGNAGGASAGNSRCITAGRVILAAGTLGSTEILLRSRDNGLSLSKRLGQGFSANGDIIAFGFGAQSDVNAIGVGHPARVELEPVGPSVSALIELNDAADLRKSITIQDGVMPSALAPALPALFIPNGRLLGALKSLIAGVYKGPFRHLQTFFAVSHDSALGELVLHKDRLRLVWPNASNEPVYKRLDQALETLVKTVGGSYVRNPLAGSIMGSQPATAHPLGGCAMGRDSSCGVVNHKAQVFVGDGGGSDGLDDSARRRPGAGGGGADGRSAGGIGGDGDGDGGAGGEAVHDGLYVIDGSIIPGSLGVNPLLTITALAERALILMANDNGWQFDDAAVEDARPVLPDKPGSVARKD